MAEYISFQPSDFYNTKLYTGNGSTQSITGVGFQPDFTWMKGRTTTGNHSLVQSPLAISTVVYSNLPNAPGTDTDALTAFGADGFTLGNSSGTNGDTIPFVSWNWKAGTTTGIAGSPSITPSSYSFNATSGFSVIAYTGNATAGATIPHGLGVAPDMIWVKNTQTAEAWACYFKPLGNTKVLTLNADNAELTQTQWNDTSPTSTVFSVGSGGNTNLSQTHVAYCFANKKGYSKVGSYEGNGNADAPFCYTGFTPAYVMLKNADASQSWQIYTWDMQPFNEFCTTDAGRLKADLTEIASTKNAMDMLSNGFKIRTSAGDINTSGQTVIYAAFAEFPIVSSNDVPTVAR